MVPILPRLSPFFPAEGVAAPLSRGIRDEFGPFISLASFSFITCFVHLPSQNLFALTLSPPSLFSPCSLPLCPSDPPPLRRTATPLLFSVSGITIRSNVGMESRGVMETGFCDTFCYNYFHSCTCSSQDFVDNFACCISSNVAFL
ncbi:hypothetical protein RHMOL_Rhmol12G0034600 [Rhododendron molle]|uniref:Uncharacterized protein n=1 Tax=Rhododendron molle TaxID=49168 RepID=A0ACC0LDU5_RHOML|nr:hypothetical protein RHMOL_Rhmol12G0034600 [Rhododendron molle]